MSLRFVQISDVHLDSKLTSSALCLPEEKRREREKEIRGTVEMACRVARDENADVVLIPGDLMDIETVNPNTVNFLIDTFAHLAPIPVIISPGNHDFYSPTSRYNHEYLAERGGPVWSDNVLIFTGARFESFPLPARDDVAVTGCSHGGNQALEDHPLAEPLPRSDRPINLLCFHGSLLGFAPRGKFVTLPFSLEELANQGFAYAAIGHYHSFRELRGEDGRLLGAYSGCPASRGLDEVGEKGFLVGRIDDNGNVDLQERRADPRILHRIEVDVTGLTHIDAIQNHVRKEVSQETERPEDMVVVHLTGRVPRGIHADIAADTLARYYHAVVDTSETRPDYDLEALSRDPGTEGAYVSEVRRRLNEEQDPERKHIIENALYYGLDALLEKKVVPRYED